MPASLRRLLGHADPSSVAVVLLALQQIGQINGGVEAHALAVQGNSGHGQRGRQVCLACARPTDEHHVLCRVGKGQACQLPDQV